MWYNNKITAFRYNEVNLTFLQSFYEVFSTSSPLLLYHLFGYYHFYKKSTEKSK